MCGIIGVLQRSGESSLSSGDLKRLRHRGPDGEGLFVEGPVALGHTRLSIIDLSESAAQPMHYNNGRYVITFNGEIYNYLELKHELRAKGEVFTTDSDTEVIMSAYSVWGADCVQRLRGMFAFAIWDREDKKLFLARDRCGERPFIYYQDNDRFIFASEFKALVPLLPGRPELEPGIVDMYLHYQYVPEPFTLLKGVHKLPAAHYMTIWTGENKWSVSPIRYWNVEEPTMDGLPTREADIDQFVRESLEEAITLTLRADVPVGVALSGGIDSGAIAALAQKNYPEPMHAFSVGYPGKPPYDEREEARALAKSLGMIFHEVELPVDKFVDFFPHMVRIMDEPIADPAAFGHYSVPKAAADLGIKVLLSGIGGDELFWGYQWVRQAATNNQRLDKYQMPEPIRSFLSHDGPQKVLGRMAGTNKLPEWIRNEAALLKWAGSRAPEGQLHFYGPTPDFAAAAKNKGNYYGPVLAALAEDNTYRPTDIGTRNNDEIPLAVQRLLFDTWLVGNCLTLGDRVSLAVGVESRLPFLDVGLIERVTALRRRWPDHYMGHKARLKSALKGVLADEILDRPKRGFQPPVWEWLSGVVKTYGGCLLEGHLVSSGMITQQAIRKSIAGEDGDWFKLFMAYKLLLLEKWYVEMCNKHLQGTCRKIANS